MSRGAYTTLSIFFATGTIKGPLSSVVGTYEKMATSYFQLSTWATTVVDLSYLS